MALLTPLRSLFQRRRVSRELDDELAFHVEMETQANVSRGLSPDEARRQALADFGGVDRTREAVLDVRSFALDSLWQDVRSAARTLTVTPGFAVAAAAMLALAIGITTAMFTVVDALVLRPVPFRDPAQLAEVRVNYDWGGPGLGLTPAVLRAWRESPAFEAVEWARADTALLEVGDIVVTRGVATVTPGVFEMLGGVRPLHGRLFYATEGRAGERDRVIVSETVWRSVLGADPALVGQRISVDGDPLTVVGILPEDFRFPASGTGLWRPIDVAGAVDLDRVELDGVDTTEQLWNAYARFAMGIPREVAVRLGTEAARAANPDNADRRLWATPLSDGLRDAYSTRAIALLAGGIVLVFLVLCANVCGLMLARLTTRRGEFGVRAVLGAARVRLMRQAFVESAVLGTFGAALGAGLAWLLVSIARALIPEQVLAQTLNTLGLDGRALAAASIAGLLATLATGLLPAWLGTRADAGDALRSRNRHGTETRGVDAGRWISDVPGAPAVSIGLSHYIVSPEFFSLYKIPIVRGRGFTESDAESDAIILSERLARAIWQDVDPVGHTARYARQSFVVGSDGPNATLAEEQILRVVGVAGEIRFPSISDPLDMDRPAVYHPYRASGTPMVSLRCEPECDVAAIRHRLASTLPAEARVQSARSGDADYVAALVRPRATAALALAFAVVALLAAATGLFSVLSYAINSRRRELGIRVALGASPYEIRRAVFRDGLFVTIAGLGVGALLAVLLARALSALQYGVSAGDPISVAIVVGTIGLTTIAAAWRPARIAARTDPAQLLREE